MVSLSAHQQACLGPCSQPGVRLNQLWVSALPRTIKELSNWSAGQAHPVPPPLCALLAGAAWDVLGDARPPARRLRHVTECLSTALETWGGCKAICAAHLLPNLPCQSASSLSSLGSHDPVRTRLPLTTSGIGMMLRRLQYVAAAARRSAVGPRGAGCYSAMIAADPPAARSTLFSKTVTPVKSAMHAQSVMLRIEVREHDSFISSSQSAILDGRHRTKVSYDV